MTRAANNILRTLRWLESSPTLEVLSSRFPKDWEVVEAELFRAIDTRDRARLDALMRPLEHLKPPPRGHRPSKSEEAAIVSKLVRQRMSAIAIERFLKSSLTDGKTINVGRLDLFIFRRLFFTRDFRRKVVSNFLFQMLWRLVQRPSLLMPMAEGHGIYCFYSKGFVNDLAHEIGVDDCLEIGAGDGALSRFLRAAGANICATDDYSWSQKIDIPDDVKKMDARTALASLSPEVVICSWPPAKNSFEQFVFKTPSVRRYVVIGSRHRFAFGNWISYREQISFKMRLDIGLSRQLLPADFGGAVYVFERK